MKTAQYYVFEMGIRDRTDPVRQINRDGPLEIGAAKKLARIGATEGKHDRAVTTNPRSRGFRIVAQYEGKTGDNVTSELYRGIPRRKKRSAEAPAAAPAPAPLEAPESPAESPDAG